MIFCILMLNLKQTHFEFIVTFIHLRLIALFVVYMICIRDYLSGSRTLKVTEIWICDWPWILFKTRHLTNRTLYQHCNHFQCHYYSVALLFIPFIAIVSYLKNRRCVDLIRFKCLLNLIKDLQSDNFNQNGEKSAWLCGLHRFRTFFGIIVVDWDILLPFWWETTLGRRIFDGKSANQMPSGCAITTRDISVGHKSFRTSGWDLLLWNSNLHGRYRSCDWVHYCCCIHRTSTSSLTNNKCLWGTQ